MASTNKTTNYELSQFIGTDKPTYLGDYNGDMLKIDTQMKANADNVATAITNASNAVSTANTANTNATNALGSATSATTAANTANTNANTALGLATNNASAIANFNLTSFTNYNTATKTGVGTLTECDINVATNSNGSLAKIYGYFRLSNVTNSSSNPGTITISTSLRPTSDITVNGGYLMSGFNTDNGYNVNTQMGSFTIRTNGNIEFPYMNLWGQNWNMSFRGLLINSLIFVKDFGDVPVTPDTDN